jgi:MFS family permease
VRGDHQTRGSTRANRALDASNFFLADVRDALGPYLAIYLLTERKWDEASIGVVMSIASIAAILAQTPAGALVDATKAKRAMMVAAAALVTAASLLLPWLSSFWPVAVSQATAHAASVVFGPALAAVTLGIVGHRAFTNRIGRNESFNHAGNACAAATAGAAAYLWGPTVVFYLLAAMSIASVISVLAIPGRAIDHDLARGLHDADLDNDEQGKEDRPSGLKVLLTCRPLLIFAACAVMFHFANAAMLPLVGQKLATRQELGHNPNVRLHRRGANRNGADGNACRAQGRRLGTQAAIPDRPASSDYSRLSLSAFQPRLLARRRAVIGRSWRGHLWRDFSGDRCRFDARNWSL